MKYAVVLFFAATYPVQELCAFLRCSRSGYYRWLRRKRTTSAKEIEDETLLEIIREVHARRRFYGYRRMASQVSKEVARRVNKKRIYRLMCKAGIQSVIRRRRYPVIPKQTMAVKCANLLKRDFHAQGPGQKLVSDVTTIIIHKRKYYVAAVQDLYHNEILAYNHGFDGGMDLVSGMLRRLFDRDLELDNAIVHSDQGNHYSSHVYAESLVEHKLRQSMSPKGSPLDNAPIESFFGHMKCETIYSQGLKSVEEVAAAIDEYMAFYNHERPQKRLNEKAPIEYLNRRK